MGWRKSQTIQEWTWGNGAKYRRPQRGILHHIWELGHLWRYRYCFHPDPQCWQREWQQRSYPVITGDCKQIYYGSSERGAKQRQWQADGRPYPWRWQWRNRRFWTCRAEAEQSDCRCWRNGRADKFNYARCRCQFGRYGCCTAYGRRDAGIRGRLRNGLCTQCYRRITDRPRLPSRWTVTYSGSVGGIPEYCCWRRPVWLGKQVWRSLYKGDDRYQ